MSTPWCTGPCSAIGSEADCRARTHESDHGLAGLAPYFRGDRSLSNFYGHSPPADSRWVTSKSIQVHEVLVNLLVKLSGEKVWLIN